METTPGSIPEHSQQPPETLLCTFTVITPPSLSYLLTAKIHSRDNVQSSTRTSKSLFPYRYAAIFIMQVVFNRWRRKWQPTPVLLPGNSHGWKILVGYSPWGHKELYMTERLHFHFHALEKEMAAHSSVLAWRIPGTGEPGGLPSMGSRRVGHD